MAIILLIINYYWQHQAKPLARLSHKHTIIMIIVKKYSGWMVLEITTNERRYTRAKQKEKLQKGPVSTLGPDKTFRNREKKRNGTPKQSN